jgi:hypothetical protein
MAQLTYWSLQQYDHLPVVRSARKAMCKQMTDMFLEQELPPTGSQLRSRDARKNVRARTRT